MPSDRLKVLHVGKYYSPFHGGIEKYMQELIESNEYQSSIDTRVIVHEHRIGRPTSSFDVNGIQGIRCKTFLKLLFTPISLSFFIELKKLINEFQPDIIHFHVPNLSAFFALFISGSRKSKWVVQWHSDVIGSQSSQLMKLAYVFYRFLEKRLLSKADSVICSSPNYLNSSEPLKPFKDKCEVIPLGIKQLRKCRDVNQMSNSLRLLMVGRLSYYKGHLILLDAIKTLENVRLTIVGQGELENEILSFIEHHKLQNKVQMKGAVSETELFDLYRNHDLLCLPSIERTEAFGVVLIEAASIGLPALVSDVQGSGMSWVVQNEKTGVVVRAEDSSDIKRKIDRIITEPVVLSDWSRNAFRRFQDVFKISSVATATLKLYKQILCNEKLK